MNNFFKMSLVAAAIAVSGTATAGTFELNADKDAYAGAKNYSTEGLVHVLADDKQYLPAISYKLGAAYIIGDELSIKFSSALDSNTVFPATIVTGGATFDKVFVNTAVAAIGNPVNSTLAGGYVTYRVVAGSAPRDTVFTLPAEKMTAADLSDATKAGIVITKATLLTTTVEAVSTTNNGASNHDINSTDPTKTILAKSITQIGTAKVATKFNNVIDATVAGVNKFTNGELNDTMSFTYVAPKVMPTEALIGLDIGTNDLTAETIAQVLTIKTGLPDGSLSADADNNLTHYKATSAKADAVVAVAADGWTVTYKAGSTPVAGDVVTITPKKGANGKLPVLAATSFAGDYKINAAATDIVTAPKVFGEWSTIGAQTVEVPYMPYGTGISQVMYVSNASSSDASVSVTAFDDKGNVFDLLNVGVAKANSVTKLATVIKNALEAKGFTDGKLSMKVKFNGNAALVLGKGGVQLHTGYNANGTDRGFVTNTSNGAL
ncbi:hypothetical protein L5M36_14000 [Shewanella sp. SM72]|uniref:hypothetical protein n=1 Tax=Shewanella sp. SM72 TaxID=2912805 RepID=UPI0021D8903A|nr:hypothetical protein [Shewanella sp. SM72]MCU8017989.1 hypothetical protein [Shewanella sp. SM72]